MGGVNLGKIPEGDFASSFSWGVTGRSPVEGGSGKAEGFGARGEASPLFIIFILKIFIIKNKAMVETAVHYVV